jgi:hypothetical protein
MKLNMFIRYQLIVMSEHARKRQDIAEGSQDLEIYVELKKNYKWVSAFCMLCLRVCS